MASVSKLNLACGREYLNGYINVDDCSMFPDCVVDKEANIKEMEMPLESVDEIRLSHFVMYTKPSELRPLLKRWFGWLTIGGKLEIESPDIKKICSKVANETDEWLIENHGLINIYGHEGTAPHVWGWYPESLLLELYDAGFKECQLGAGLKKRERDFRIIAIKHGK
jgi:hypothetical protein